MYARCVDYSFLHDLALKPSWFHFLKNAETCQQAGSDLAAASALQ